VPGELTLRRAVGGDALAVAELFLRSKRERLPYLPELHADDETRAWMAQTVFRDCEVWVAEAGGELAGFVAATRETVEHLYVLPGQQGRGAGSVLLERAKARSAGVLRLWAFQRNERARCFYERRGFRAVRFGDGSQNEENEPDVLYEWRAG